MPYIISIYTQHVLSRFGTYYTFWHNMRDKAFHEIFPTYLSHFIVHSSQIFPLHFSHAVCPGLHFKSRHFHSFGGKTCKNKTRPMF